MSGAMGLCQRGLGGSSSPVVMYGNGRPCAVALVVLVGEGLLSRSIVVAVAVLAVVAVGRGAPMLGGGILVAHGGRGPGAAVGRGRGRQEKETSRRGDRADAGSDDTV